MEYIQAKKYDFEDVNGMTLNQLNQHYKLYEGYVNKVNEIWTILGENKLYENPNTTYSETRSLMLGQSYAVDGVKLHELYFSNLVGGNNLPYGDILNQIQKKYGSYEFFTKRLKNVGLSMRGWVVLSIDSLDNNLHIYGLDAHDVGTVLMSYPLLVMDVYEHAYMIDFGIDRNKYIDVFIENINWDVVNERFMNYKKMTKDIPRKYRCISDEINIDKVYGWANYCKD
ncbi:superoxide dismutase [Tepidibacter aestuarii]|uniref:superoxide dismutase n=1 Tax=Tepidibacter aestuarii TaxID=2925782 RepID=UPI0020BE9C18|nr:Fe-Mn family superoxide dismutase [Tepidibacter aestuarii]CAH2212607.1 Superoxide dismutase [Fe] [Tepidibacter aestuarii]